jgi:hypothetical protein
MIIVAEMIFGITRVLIIVGSFAEVGINHCGFGVGF